MLIFSCGGDYMYRISEFSKISNTPIQTLRYYDNLQLLKPKVIGEYNNYRYYTKEQVLKLEIIKKMKKMGFCLKEILEIMKQYDEKKLLSHKDKLQKEIANKIQYVKEIEKLIVKMQNDHPNFEKELIYLTNNKERSENMKEKYTEAKAKLLECYKLYQEKNFEDCISLLEELKSEIFYSDEATDPFWVNSAGDLFAGIVFEVFKTSKKDDISFLTIFEFNINGKSHINNLKEYVNSLPKDSYSYLCLASISSAPYDTQASLISVYQQIIKGYARFETKN